MQLSTTLLFGAVTFFNTVAALGDTTALLEETLSTVDALIPTIDFAPQKPFELIQGETNNEVNAQINEPQQSIIDSVKRIGTSVREAKEEAKAVIKKILKLPKKIKTWKTVISKKKYRHNSEVDSIKLRVGDHVTGKIGKLQGEVSSLGQAIVKHEPLKSTHGYERIRILPTGTTTVVDLVAPSSLITAPPPYDDSYGVVGEENSLPSEQDYDYFLVGEDGQLYWIDDHANKIDKKSAIGLFKRQDGDSTTVDFESTITLTTTITRQISETSTIEITSSFRSFFFSSSGGTTSSVITSQILTEPIEASSSSSEISSSTMILSHFNSSSRSRSRSSSSFSLFKPTKMKSKSKTAFATLAPTSSLRFTSRFSNSTISASISASLGPESTLRTSIIISSSFLGFSNTTTPSTNSSLSTTERLNILPSRSFGMEASGSIAFPTAPAVTIPNGAPITARPVTYQINDPAVGSVVDPVIDPVVDPVVESSSTPMVHPVIDPVVSPAADDPTITTPALCAITSTSYQTLALSTSSIPLNNTVCFNNGTLYRNGTLSFNNGTFLFNNTKLDHQRLSNGTFTNLTSHLNQTIWSNRNGTIWSNGTLWSNGTTFGNGTYSNRTNSTFVDAPYTTVVPVYLVNYVDCAPIQTTAPAIVGRDVKPQTTTQFILDALEDGAMTSRINFLLCGLMALLLRLLP